MYEWYDIVEKKMCEIVLQKTLGTSGVPTFSEPSFPRTRKYNVPRNP